MSRRRCSKLLGIAVVVPLFLGAVAPDQLRTLVCRYTGVVMPEEACCPQRSDLDVQAPARLRDESCCAVKIVRLVKLVSDQRNEAAPPGHLDVPARLVTAESNLIPVRVVRVLGPSTPADGPPMILVKHAFLI